MSNLIKIKDDRGEVRIINKNYIVKIEKTSKGYTTIWLEIPASPSSFIEYIGVDESIDEIYDLLHR